MRNVLVFVVMSGVLGFLAPGCALSSDEATPPAQTSQFGFTRDSAGQARPSDAVSLDSSTPQHSFDHTVANRSDPAATEIDPQAVACFGACNANVCVCSGDFDCCVAGCVICWQVVN